MTNTPTIGFASMTHLGLNSAVAAAHKGFRTVGFDPNETLIKQLQSGQTSINEPDLSELLRANAQNLEFTSSAADLRTKCDIVYISMDVPTDDKGSASDLTPITNIDRYREQGDVGRCIASRVMPGTARLHAQHQTSSH